MADVYPQESEHQNVAAFEDDDSHIVAEPHYAEVKNESRLEDAEAHVDISSAPVLPSQTESKKEKKQLEKERKEREKQEKLLLKKQEQQIKEEAKKQKESAKKKEPEKKKKSKVSSVVSPQRPGVRPKNIITCHVRLLDGTDCQLEIEKNAKAKLLIEMVCEHNNLLERDYFSCSYENDGTKFWLLPERRIAKQIGRKPWNFEFGVKFYAPEPSLLQEDITRYLFCLQLRNDILSEKLPCSFVTHALLGAYTVQSELGDYDPSEHGKGYEYLREFQFCPNQTDELLDKIAQLHRTLRGQTPAEAEMNFLENAKKLELYGTEMQSAKDAEMVNIMVGVSAMGIVVYRDEIRINRFPWPVVLKMSYIKDNFNMKIRPAEYEEFITTIAFDMPSHKLAKRFWRLAIQHHSFFRLKEPVHVERGVFTRFGSSKHRFSGRTYYQSRTWATSITRQAPYFERTASRQMTMPSLGSSSQFGRRKDFESYEEEERRQNDEGQIAVLAGTAPAGSRVAYVKTIRSEATGESSREEQNMSYTSGDYRYQREPVDSPPVSSFRGDREPDSYDSARNERVVTAVVTNVQSHEWGADEDRNIATYPAVQSSTRTVEVEVTKNVPPKKKKVPTATLR